MVHVLGNVRSEQQARHGLRLVLRTLSRAGRDAGRRSRTRDGDAWDAHADPWPRRVLPGG